MRINWFFLRTLKSNTPSQLSWALLILLIAGFGIERPLFAQPTQPTDNQATALIMSAGLNVRSDPGLGFAIIGYARYGDTLPILGQAEQCRWLLVRTANANEGWISGKPAYTMINGECATIRSQAVEQSSDIRPQVTVPVATPPVPIAITAAVAATLPAATPPSTPATTPIPDQSTVAAAQPVAGQGCYLLQNRLGPPITVTFTNKENGKSVQVNVPHGAEVVHCMAAGEYTYTVSAAGFRDRNGELKIIAGDAYMLPIGAQ